MNLPNTLTFARILMVPVLVVVLLTRVSNHEFIGVVVFWIASLTDWLDGYLARRWRQVTTLGKLLDPLADKLLVAGALISLVELRGPGDLAPLAPAWMVFIILAREFAITGLRGIASEEGVTIAAGTVGKWKLGFQVAAISLLILGSRLDDWALLHTKQPIFRHFITIRYPYSFFWGLGVLLLWVAVILAIWSAVAYFHGFWKALGPRILASNGRLTGGDGE
ncbi:MAG TPA: CDP-diacylglycerol--glycerol-3-phosphate 3-phosphatidyltransferase [Holophagaceae bacterium]|nr:CDP-diacylglycerol--glycerol-3-phosphate 3-phosphatidyltransferase [Holophagaceae bacterium]